MRATSRNLFGLLLLTSTLGAQGPTITTKRFGIAWGSQNGFPTNPNPTYTATVDVTNPASRVVLRLSGTELSHPGYRTGVFAANGVLKIPVFGMASYGIAGFGVNTLKTPLMTKTLGGGIEFTIHDLRLYVEARGYQHPDTQTLELGFRF